MAHRYKAFVAATICVIALGSRTQSAAQQSPGAVARESRVSLSAEDLVRFAEIGNPLAPQGSDASTNLLRSPDGRWEAFVVTGGDPASGANIASIYVIAAQDATQPVPVKLATMRSTSNQPPIARIEWLPDNDGIAWIGTDDRGTGQVFTAAIGRAPRQRTREPNGVVLFELSADGRYLIAVAEGDSARPCAAELCLVDSPVFYDEPDAPKRTDFGPRSTFVYDLASGARKRVPDPPPFEDGAKVSRCDSRQQLISSLSPDGRYLLRVCDVDRLPDAWRVYDFGTPLARMCGKRCMNAMILTDLRTGAQRQFLATPYNPYPLGATQPIWIDPKRVLLPIAWEPATAATSPAMPQTHQAMMEYDVATGQGTVIHRYADEVVDLDGVRWDAARGVLTGSTYATGGIRRPFAWRRHNRSWQPATGTGVAAGSSDLSLVQSIDQRPTIVWHDRTTGMSRTVFDPNPWLDQRDIGRTEIVEWQSGGSSWKGVLFLPPDFNPAKRYPLVIQTHHYDEKRFSLTGYVGNYPGRALAARGMLVLQTRETLGKAALTPDEYPVVRAGYEAAIDMLAKRGSVDPTRIGLIGFSWTVTSVGSMLTHSEHPIAAAAMLDGGDTGWLNYWLLGGNENNSTMVGGVPVGEDLKPWLENVSTFNLQRVRTPLLIAGHPITLPRWDWFAGLRKLNKPVEMWRATDGVHVLYRVPQRLAENQLLVDWFAFWLKDEQRDTILLGWGETGEKLQAQYARWHHYREQQRNVESTPRPPLLDWKATPRVRSP